MPECIAFVRKERAAYRLAISCGNERTLAEIRDNRDGNQMARVHAIRAIEQLGDNDIKPGNAVSPGITIRVLTVIQPNADVGKMIDETPTRRAAPLAAPADDEPIFRRP